MSGYGRMIRALEGALVGTGQNGDMFKVLKSEAKLLSAEIARQVGPASVAGGEKSVARSVGQFFSAGPERIFPGRNQPDRSVVWLYATPKFLVGVRREDFLPNPGLEFMERVLRAGQRASPKGRGKAVERLGPVRNRNQTAVIINRTLVSRERVAALAEKLFERVGRAKASWALAASRLGLGGISSWISRHFGAVQSEGVAVFRFRVSSPADVGIEFGSRAPGVNRNPVLVAKIESAIRNRRAKLAEKVRRVLSGYAYDWNTAGVVKPNRGEQEIRRLEANEAAWRSL